MIPQETAYQRIGVGDFSLVGIRSEAARIGLRSAVREVGIVEVDPGEKGLPAIASPEPFLERGEDPVASALRFGTLQPRRSRPQIVVVQIESLGEAEAPVENEAPDESSGLVPGFAKSFRERPIPVAETKASVSPYAVLWRGEPGQDRRVGRKRQRRRRPRPREDDSAPRQLVEARGRRAAQAVLSEKVGTEGVQGYEQDRGLLRGRRESQRGQERGEHRARF